MTNTESREALEALDAEMAELDLPVLIADDTIRIIADEMGIDANDVIRQYDIAIDPNRKNENTFQNIISALIDYALENQRQLQDIRRGLEIEREMSHLAEL